MTFIAAVLILPLLTLALAGGCGLLVERAAGRRLPGTLVLPVGLALMVALAQVGITFPATAKLGAFAMLAAALAGWALGGRELVRRERRIEPWAAAAVGATYLIGASAVILTGDVTMPGYLLDGTVAIHLLGADHLVEHGRDFSMLADSSAQGAVAGYFAGNQYPAGSMTLLGALGRFVPIDLSWLYQPLVASCVAIATLPLYEIARRIGARPWQAAGAALLAASPALVVAYALMGAIKEMVVLPFLLALVPLVLDYREHLRDSSPRSSVIPLAVVGAAGIAAIGLAFSGWLALALVICLALALHGLRRGRLSTRAVVTQAALLAGVLAVLSAPTLRALSSSLQLAGDLSETNAGLANDPGNLLRPLKLTQIFGIWLSGEHRVNPPDSFAQTELLIGVAIVAFALGLGWLARAGRWLLLTSLAGFALALWLLTLRGTDWLDAKLLVLTSPLVVLVAVLGALGLDREGRRVEAALLAGALTFGVLASTVMLIHATNIAPTDRLRELESIGERYAGDGPTYLADFDEMALYYLRRLDPEGPGYAHRTDRTYDLNYGQPPRYGLTYDTDDIAWGDLRKFALVVRRRGPNSSDLPSGYGRVFAGRYYEVWRRGDVSRVLEHYGFGGRRSPGGVPKCQPLRSVAEAAVRAGNELRVAVRKPAVRLDPAKAKERPHQWPKVQGGGLSVSGQGLIQQGFGIEHGGRYRLWVEGDITRTTSVRIDGREVLSARRQVGGDLNVAGGVELSLTPGPHLLDIWRPGGSARVGDAAPGRIVQTVLQPIDDSSTRSLPASEWGTLCRRDDVDWVEVIRR